MYPWDLWMQPERERINTVKSQVALVELDYRAPNWTCAFNTEPVLIKQVIVL